jgi:hypothetical protein
VGRATVRAFARRGTDVGLVARGRDGLETARREVEALGSRAVVAPADVAGPDQVEAAADTVERALGPIDIWVNNAMTSVFSPVKEMTPEEFHRVTEVTYLGTVYGTLAALRRMLPRDRGVIVEVGSALAYRGIQLQAAYSAAKHAGRVRVVMVQLPALNTPQFGWVRTRLPRKPQPVPPIYQPEVAVEAIVWAAYHERRELNVGLPTSVIVPLNNLLPGLGDRYLARTGYRSQQSSEPVDPHRRDNLWDPVPGDHGAHGVASSMAARTVAVCSCEGRRTGDGWRWPPPDSPARHSSGGSRRVDLIRCGVAWLEFEADPREGR